MIIKIILFVLIFAGYSFGKESLSTPNVDHIFDSLSNQQWDADEASCRDRIFNILQNVKNSTLWAIWVWNSIEQSPTGIFFGARYHLGSYDQCLRPPWLSTHPELRTQYCLAEIQMNKGGVKTIEQVADPYVRAEEYYLHTKTKFGLSFSYAGQGVCLPAGCPNKSVEKFVKALMNTGYLHAAKDASVTIRHCEEAGATREFTNGFYVYIYAFAALLLLAITSTYYVNNYPVSASSNSFVNHVATSFCLRRNWESIVKEDEDALTCLHGIRFLTSNVIILVHVFIFTHATSVNNALDLDLITDNDSCGIFQYRYFWNSIEQSPTGIFFGARYHLGSYDQCLRPPWLSTHPELRTQYCLAEIQMNKGGVKTIEQVADPYVRAEEYYLHTKTKFGLSFSYAGQGVCLPAGCPNKSVEKFVKALMNTGYLHAAKDASVTIRHCEEAGATREFTNGFYVYIYAFAALLLLAITSTYYVNNYPVSASSNSFVNHVATSFCLRRNWESIVKEDEDALTCLHGIRFLTSNVIILVHVFIFTHATSVNNALDLDLEIQNAKTSIFTVHADINVDTFFAISALLLGKSLATMDITNPYTLVKTILKRYVRLIGMFAVTAFYFAHVSIHTDDGPIYPEANFIEQEACQKNWWLGFLMVGNYFNITEMCHPTSWYINCDFQLYVATLVIFYLYRKNPSLGKAIATVVVVAGFLAPGITTYFNDLPAVFMDNLGEEMNIRKNRVFKGYIETHNRMGPYMAGLALGYLMSIYKPKDHKKVWSKTVSFLGVYASLTLMLAVLMAGKLCFLYQVHGLPAFLFTILNRTIFGICVLGVIVFCTYGDVPLINSFLSWKVFAPLSRLSYGVYLIHVLVLNRGTTSIRSHLKHHKFDIILGCSGLLVVSLVLSLAVWLLVEAPFINITNRYLNTKIPKDEKVQEYRNGVHEKDTTKQKTM